VVVSVCAHYTLPTLLKRRVHTRDHIFASANSVSSITFVLS
jgi:hypothetical protein